VSKNEKTVGPCYRNKREVCAEKGKGVSIVKRKNKRDA